ncbi:transposase [uncultured Deinococcus sp.]|uniref:transposase n=1 Tax=uncultured Deinococcus sp. TaxID=158789 RepID=UPI00345B576D
MPEWLEAQGLGGKAFHVLPRRWGVERSFAWMGRNRRLSRDVETLLETEETWCDVAMTRLLLRRLATL